MGASLSEFRLWTKKVEIFRRYKLVIKIINSTVLNKLQSYSRISALVPEGHCTSRFTRAMCISCRPACARPQEGRGVWLMWTHVDRTVGVSKIRFFGRHKWMAPNVRSALCQDAWLPCCYL